MHHRHIQTIKAREILDSRGQPTVEAAVILSDGSVGRAAAPSGASTGSHELAELRDNDYSRYMGKGVTKAVGQVNGIIGSSLQGKSVCCQQELDSVLHSLIDPKSGKPLGSNSMLAVSLACAKAAAVSYRMPLYRYLGGANANILPMPMMNILNGGVHAGNNLDIQEFMIIPAGAQSFSQALEWCCKVYSHLKALFKEKNLCCAVGDEGGFAPNLNSDEEALALIMDAVERAAFKPESDFVIALDAAASEWKAPAQDGETRYTMPKSQHSYTTAELISYWEGLCAKYPIRSIEDPLGEDDWQGFTQLNYRLGSRIQIVGDDLFVTDTKRIEEGIGIKAANAVLIKPNQIGTLTKTLEAVSLARKAGWQTVISHRSGETEDSTIADIAVAASAGQVKFGAPCRSERCAKYNQLLRIEEALGNHAGFAGWNLK